MKRFFVICIFLLFVFFSFSQKTCVGKLIAIDSKEPVSFANIWVKNDMRIYCLSQLDGSFSIKVPKNDSIMISSVGYKDYIIPYSQIQNSELIVELIPAPILIQMAVVTPGKSRSIPIVKNAIKNRHENRPDLIENIDFIEYNKLNLSLSNIDSSITNSRFISKHQDIVIKANNYDTTWAVPFYFSERLTYEKRVKNTIPEVQQIVQNQHGSNFIHSDLAEKYINSLNENMTFYGNLRFLSKDLISPISTQALLYYKYYLKDSIIHDSNTYYLIDFKPRNALDLAFIGHMVIEKNTWVLTEIQATLQPSANLNFVKQLSLQEKLQKRPDGTWFYKQQKFEVKFTPEFSKDTSFSKLAPPISAIKTTGYIIDSLQIQNYLQNRELPSKFNITYRQIKPDTNLLAIYRPDTLTSLDITTRGAIEASNKIPIMRLSNNILSMLLYGYYPLEYINLGPYLYFLQANEIEGVRYNLSGQTSEKFAKGFLMGGYIGYGTKDKKVKYGANFSLTLPTKLYGALHASYDQNIYRIGDYKQNLGYIRENAWVQSDDNFLSALSSKSPNYAVYSVKKGVFSYEQQIHPNLIVKPTYSYSQHFDAPYYHFDTTNQSIKKFDVHEISCNFRVSFKEEISNGHFRRMYIDSRYPVFNFNIAQGQYSYANICNNYTQLRFTARHNILFGVGRIKYVLESGYTFGKVPFPLLEFYRGNETGSSGEYYFNLMKYLEFSSDRFVNVFAEYGMNGFIFNKIPLIKKLYLRELLTFKACWGSMQYNHGSVFPLPTYTQSLTVPYMEAGIGVSNIFKLFRFEYVWRLNYLDAPDVMKSGFFFGFRFEF